MSLPQTAPPLSLQWWVFEIVDQDGKKLDPPEVIIGTGRFRSEARKAAQALAPPGTIAAGPNRKQVANKQFRRNIKVISKITSGGFAAPAKNVLSEWRIIMELLENQPAVRLTSFQYGYALVVGLKEAGRYVAALLVAHDILQALSAGETHMRQLLDALIREILEELGKKDRKIITEIMDALDIDNLNEKLDAKR